MAKIQDFQIRFEAARMATQIVCSGKIPADRLGEAAREIYGFFREPPAKAPVKKK